MFLDEAIACERTEDRKYAWTRRDRKINVVTLFKRNKRWSILFAFTLKSYIVWTIHHDSITQEIFNDFVRYYVLSLTSSTIYESKNSVLILNNVSTHKSVELQEMCTEIDVKLIFLSSYSSDYNFIKISFAILKKWIKRHDDLIEKYEFESENFERFLHEAVHAQTQRNNSDNLFRTSDISLWKFKAYVLVDHLM